MIRKYLTGFKSFSRNAYVPKLEVGKSLAFTDFHLTKPYLQEDIRDSGVIPFFTDEMDYNPGRILEIYLERLHPGNGNMFQTPCVPSKKWDIHRRSCNVWFVNQNLGKNQVGPLLKELCNVVGVPPLSNHSIRYELAYMSSTG